MMRLPWFEYRAPRSVDEVTRILAGEGPNAMLVAGGTDLLPNMKRRHQSPSTLVALRGVEDLKEVVNGAGLRLGAGLTLARLVALPAVRRRYTGLWQAAAQVATPHLRNMGTLGGNVCLDTRCTYYNQNYEWRQAIDFCLKKDGETCWVATASKRCVAVSSTDTAPALIALGAQVVLASADGERTIPLADFYADDGIVYLRRRPAELLTDANIENVVAIGYNGNARGFPNRCDGTEPGRCGCIHSEQNAMVKAPGAMRDKVAFVTASPCVMCAKLMVQAKVTHVFYREVYRDDGGLGVLEQAGVVIVHYTRWKDAWRD